MTIAVISDVHGNLPALEQVLREVDETGVDLIVVGGDVANGPMPRETTELLMGLSDRARFVRGNGDRELVACFDGVPPAASRPEDARRVVPWCVTQLERRHRDFLASFEETVVVEEDDLGVVLCCHGSPRSDVDVFTVRSPDDQLRSFFAGVRAQVVTCGHTHMQFERDLDGMHIVNVGSVGMPYGDQPGAFWCVLGPEVVLRRTVYDFEAAAERIRRTAYPLADRFADRNVLLPPSAEEAFAYMERTAAVR